MKEAAKDVGEMAKNAAKVRAAHLSLCAGCCAARLALLTAPFRQLLLPGATPPLDRRSGPFSQLSLPANLNWTATTKNKNTTRVRLAQPLCCPALPPSVCTATAAGCGRERQADLRQCEAEGGHGALLGQGGPQAGWVPVETVGC